MAEAPGFCSGQRSLGENLIRQGKYSSAAVHIEGMLAEPGLRAAAQVLEACLADAQGDYRAARSRLEAAVRQFPNEPEPLQALCKLLFERGDLTDAERALKTLLELQPDDAPAHHNLGAVLLHTGRHKAAVDSLRRSLELRPDSPSTWKMLADALSLLGDREGAAQASRQAER